MLSILTAMKPVVFPSSMHYSNYSQLVAINVHFSIFSVYEFSYGGLVGKDNEDFKTDLFQPERTL